MLTSTEIVTLLVFAEKTLRDCHTTWLQEEGSADGQDGIGFFRNLVDLNVPGFHFCMSPEVEQYWRAQGLLDNGGFLGYVTPFLEATRTLLGFR